ncbi:pectin lyase-like protein [Coniochaeta ligniaria NRRL 30616]|uniref:Pectin lyase-like protein n=1 Tax=Coniochaeta ligniaria NRRL 30616 TaxID=1408157 RepID=A0A1J7JAY6_9PEZI|nr:pectin lyase-like protein [Coniochaeta ligniaria NRRL 30616]
MARPTASLARAVLLCSTLLLGLATCHDTTRKVKAGQSIQAVINDAQPGDHIVVEAGTYTEQLTITKNNIQLSAKKGVIIVPPSAPTPNSCSGLAGPGSEAGICISGADITFGDLEMPGHRKVTTVGHYVENVKVEGFNVIGFGLNIAILGAKDADVRKNTVSEGGWYGILTVGSVSSLVTRNTVKSSGLFFIGICMDDKSDVHVTQNVISDYGIGLCVQTNGADVGHNKVSNCCFGAFIDPFINGAKVTHNHIGPSNPLCQTQFGGFSGGILVDGATNAEVRHNDVSGITDYGNPNQTAYGIGIVDEPGTTATGNQVTHNTLYNNDLDILFFTLGTDNEVAHNNCTTPSELCSK